MARKCLSRAMVLASLAWTSVAMAIGPANQTVDPPFTGVVRILYDNNNPDGTGEFEGTGSLIDNMNIAGAGWFCILTADHVISSTGQRGGALFNSPGIAFGNSGNDTGNTAYMTADPLAIFRGGATGNADIAVLGVHYGPFDPVYTPFVRKLVPATAFFFFSDIGFGNEGDLVAGGYQAQNKYGTQRYLNEKIGVFASNFTALGYTYEAAEWPVEDPATATIQGTGTTFDADSGSPYFSTTTEHDAVNDIDFFTDNQFAVHAGTIPKEGDPAGFKSFGTINYGVALNTDEIAWIEARCAEVPEPGSLALVATGACLLLQRRLAP